MSYSLNLNIRLVSVIDIHFPNFWIRLWLVGLSEFEDYFILLVSNFSLKG